MSAQWLWGLAGGGIIGMAGAILLLVNGRIMGVSGIIAAVTDGTDRRPAPGRHDHENLAFVAGLLLAPGLLWILIGRPETHLTSNPLILIGAGLAVGAGTRLANGCTSGHGVCGLSRLSPRAIVATVLYLLAGAATVIAFRHGLGAI
jgi:uncharacterized membrane protein YedE/YeeE